jgi:tRNA-dihydrouridine synthase B
MSVELKPFRVGGIVVASPMILSPMAGYTDLPFRLLCRRMGCPYTVSEMMLDRLVLLKGKLQVRMLAISPDDHPCAGQITGNEPDVMARSAEALCEHGYDAVDLNFACPVRKAISRERGGFLLRRPKLAGEIVRAVVRASGKPVTIKLRRGFADETDPDDAEQTCDPRAAEIDEADNSDAFWAIAEESFAAGAAAIAVHARSVEARYRGRADWDFLAAVKRRFADRTIIGSGDVMTAQAALDMPSRTGVDAAAVARGALGNPWIFRQALDLAAGRPPCRPTLAQQRAVMEEHFAGAVELYGPSRGPKIMRKHSIKYARLHPRPKTVRIAMAAVRTPDQWRGVLDRFYTQETGEEPAETANHSHEKE